MSVVFSSECILCHLRRNIETARSLGTEEQATAFARELLKMYLSAPEGVGSPWFGPATTDLYHEMYGLDLDRYRQEKEDSNRFVLERLGQIRARVEKAEDPVYAGLQFAVLGNYIDFSALKDEIDFDQLDEMLKTGEQIDLDREAYASLCADFEKGKQLLYLTDNAGEIGFDRVLAEQIHKKYPHLNITFCVRGAPALNDATREDAQVVGIPFKVIDNGNRIAGTQIELLGEEAKAALDSADVILAKGQGNVETLYGSKYSIYFAFLTKCDLIMEVFQKPFLTPMLVHQTSR